MGYSCTAKASYVRDAVSNLIAEKYPEHKTSNAMPDGGFWETGRENADGAITGTVWKMVDAEHARRAGSFKISADGKIERWPGLSKELKEAAVKAGAKRYEEIHGA